MGRFTPFSPFSQALAPSHQGPWKAQEHLHLWSQILAHVRIYGSAGKESACSAGDVGLIPGLGRSPGEGNGNHSSIFTWKIPWTEEPGGFHFHQEAF